MKLFVGLERSDYQDVLRALGLYLDEHQYTNVRILETEEGLVVQGVRRQADGTLSSRHESYLFNEQDLENILQVAYQRREQGGNGE
jgi:hypothetical protein